MRQLYNCFVWFFPTKKYRRCAAGPVYSVYRGCNNTRSPTTHCPLLNAALGASPEAWDTLEHRVLTLLIKRSLSASPTAALGVGPEAWNTLEHILAIV